MSQVGPYLLGLPGKERDDPPVKLDIRKAVALLADIAGTAPSHHLDSFINLLWPDWTKAAAAPTFVARCIHSAEP